MFHSMTLEDISTRSKEEQAIYLAMSADGYHLFYRGVEVATSIVKDGCLLYADHLQHQWQLLNVDVPFIDMTRSPVTTE